MQKQNDYDPNHVEEKVYARVGQKAIIVNIEGKMLVLQRSNKAGAGRKWI